MKKAEVKQFIEANLRLPAIEERRVARGNRTVSLDIVLENHSMTNSGLLGGGEFDFLAGEDAFAPEESAMKLEHLIVQILALNRQPQNGPRINQILFATEITRLIVQGGVTYVPYVVYALNAGVPWVSLERWGTSEVATYEGHHEAAMIYYIHALQLFSSGKIAEALDAFSKYITIESIGIKVRNNEIAKNILRLYEIIGMRYFGLGKESLHGIAFIGANHYDVLEIVSNASASGNVIVSTHPSSIDPADLRRVSYFDQIFNEVKDKLNTPSSLDFALQQASELKTTYAELTNIMLRSLTTFLISGIFPEVKPKEIDSDPLLGFRITHYIVSQLTHEEIEELSVMLGERWFKGQQFGQLPSKGEEIERLRTAVNNFLAVKGYQTTPATQKQRNAFRQAYLA